jgi:alanine racemase
MPFPPLRLRLDGAALVANWRWLKAKSGGAACGAAVKADGYGLGAREVVRRLAGAGCRDFFVATWAEAEGIADLIGEASLSVLHGFFEEDLAYALASPARPVINTAAQARRWRGTARPCDVMIDTGINRLGLLPAEVAEGALDGLEIDTLLSHFACADEDVAKNEEQRRLFEEVSGRVPAKRRSLSNSAGICLGAENAYDLTRPGLALYGGIPRPEAEGHIAQVVRVEARVIQRKRVEAGGSVGYNATFVAEEPCELAIVNVGYADGYLRGFSGTGAAIHDGRSLPVVGRVSMDLTAIRVDDSASIAEGDWLELDFDLPRAARQSGLSQYELLTTMGSRYARAWS